MKLFNVIRTTLFLGTSLIISCSSDDDNFSPEDQSAAITVENIALNYSTIVLANYQDALDDAKTLQNTLNTFIATPNQVNFEASKQAWLTARESYGTTEAFRFANGPIDRETVDNSGNVIDEGPEGLLNSWPLDENFIDYVEGTTASGIINTPTTYPTITKEILISKNGDGGETNVSIGYHAIEFLLWGQDNTAPAEKQAGLRSFTDFVDGSTTATNQNRRRDYLIVCANLLIENLEFLVDQWTVGTNYNTEFLALENNAILTNLLKSIAELSGSELAGERMATALEQQNQEDEHSCFSDNTHRDIILNFEGIKNVYFGEYKNISGISLENLITREDANAAKKIADAFTLAENSINAIAIPFDFAISEGATSVEGAKVSTAVDALRLLGDALVEAGSKLGLQINI